VVIATDPYGLILGFLDQTFFYITYIISVHTSQETQYISVLKPGNLTISQRRSTFFYITNINPVRTSQETQYVCIL
jgi:hypothetical protein